MAAAARTAGSAAESLLDEEPGLSDSETPLAPHPSAALRRTQLPGGKAAVLALAGLAAAAAALAAGCWAYRQGTGQPAAPPDVLGLAAWGRSHAHQDETKASAVPHHARLHHPPGPGSPDLLDAGTISQFMTPLVIPPVMRHSKGRRHHYDIAARQFKQQVLPKPHPPTTVWGYGPKDDPEPDSQALGGGKGVAPAPNSQFNYPGYTVEVVKGQETTVNWINDLVRDPWPHHPHHFKREDNEGSRRHYLRSLLPVDQTLHWANPGGLPCEDPQKTKDCRPTATSARNLELQEPYAGPVPIVTHVHGSRSQPESDGYPEAWYLPDADNIPKGYSRTGSLVNMYGHDRKTNRVPGAARFEYGEDPTSKTIWYHDHALGVTRTNVYAGLAGFWLIRDDEAKSGETGLVKGRLPHPAPKAGEDLAATNLSPGRNKYREIPVVIQDRSFKSDGSLFFPSRRDFYSLPKHLINVPFIGGDVDSDIPPIWGPEFYGTVMVVNGASWPLLEVEPDIYRFRLLNGCNDRFLNLALHVLPADGCRPRELPFYQIAAEQGLLPQVVKVTTGYKTVLPGGGARSRPTKASSSLEALLMAPGERADVLVDFSRVKPGCKVSMLNTGPDEPFQGFGGNYTPANVSTTGQVMRFRMVPDTRDGEGATRPQDLVLSLPDEESPANAERDSVVVRDLALLEQDSSRICVYTIGNDIYYDPHATVSGSTCVNGHESSAPFGPVAILLGVNGSRGGSATMWASPIATNPLRDAVEEWEFWNWTPDVHSIHLHLVRFRVIERWNFDPNGTRWGRQNPDPTEAGWKDTVKTYPSQVTRVRAQFDIDGLYVWHCHMLDHEDNEMMVPFCVGSNTTAPGCKFAGR